MAGDDRAGWTFDMVDMEMISREELLTKLQLCVDDPMWPDHVEMPKQLIRIVIEQLTRHGQCARSIDGGNWIDQQHQIDRYGVALMMIREGCSDPAGLARRILSEFEFAAVTSTVHQAIEKTEGGASIYCAHCDHEHPLHEDARGFHHVIRGERVPCCSVPSTDDCRKDK